MTASTLPLAFAELEPFVAIWGHETTQARLNARCSQSMPEIRAFYDRMVERAEEAMAYVDQFPLNQLPEDASRLMSLVLALAQAHVAIEIHGQPRAPGTPWPNTMRIAQGLPVLG